MHHFTFFKKGFKKPFNYSAEDLAEFTVSQMEDSDLPEPKLRVPKKMFSSTYKSTGIPSLQQDLKFEFSYFQVHGKDQSFTMTDKWFTMLPTVLSA